MQTTPMISCIQRYPLDGAAVGAAAFVLDTMNSSHRVFLINYVAMGRRRGPKTARRKLGISYSKLQDAFLVAMQQLT
jgi:hypothetical protein